jgi:hypothetical protein
VSAEDDRRAGVAAAELLLGQGVRVGPAIRDPLSGDFATALVDRLARGLTDDRPGWVDDVMDGTNRLARNLNVEPEHG